MTIKKLHSNKQNTKHGCHFMYTSNTSHHVQQLIQTYNVQVKFTDTKVCNMFYQKLFMYSSKHQVCFLLVSSHTHIWSSNIFLNITAFFNFLFYRPSWVRLNICSKFQIEINKGWASNSVIHIFKPPKISFQILFYFFPPPTTMFTERQWLCKQWPPYCDISPLKTTIIFLIWNICCWKLEIILLRMIFLF